jgi:hypothetical protein
MGEDAHRVCPVGYEKREAGMVITAHGDDPDRAAQADALPYFVAIERVANVARERGIWS